MPRELVNFTTVGELLSGLEGLSTALLVHWFRPGSAMGYQDLRQLLLNPHCQGHIHTQALEVLAQHPSYAAELMSLAIRHLPQHHFCISKATLLSIARNEKQGREMMKTLATHCRENITLTESVVLALHRNRNAGLNILREFAPTCPGGVELKITGHTALALWEDETQGREILKLLFQMFRMRLYFQPTELPKIKAPNTSALLLSSLLEECSTLLPEEYQSGCEDDDNPLMASIRAGRIFISDIETTNLAIDELHSLTYGQTDTLLCQLRRAILHKNSAVMATLASHISMPALRKEDVDMRSRTPLFLAAERGDVHALYCFLISRDGAYNNHVDDQDSWGESPLALASRYGHAEVVKHLLCEHAAAIHSKSLFGWTPLHLAAGQGHVSVLNELLASGANINAKTSLFGWTPLHLGAEGGHSAVVHSLIRLRARVEVRSDIGDTALDLASREGHLRIAAELSLIQY